MLRFRTLRLALPATLGLLAFIAGPAAANAHPAVAPVVAVIERVTPGLWQAASSSLTGFELVFMGGLGRAFGTDAAIHAISKAMTRPVLGHVPLDGDCDRSSAYGMRRHPVLKRRRMHRGIDFAARRGTPVLAAGSGVVTFAGRQNGYGQLIIIDHGHGLTTRYGHLRRIKVNVGDRVAPGQTIGQVGSSGRATGPHLHFEVRVAGKAVDPIRYTGFAMPPAS
jgi:murein DD-endopeptidase MepM/ murein hydrolase activator NlpD